MGAKRNSLHPLLGCILSLGLLSGMFSLSMILPAAIFGPVFWVLQVHPPESAFLVVGCLLLLFFSYLICSQCCFFGLCRLLVILDNWFGARRANTFRVTFLARESLSDEGFVKLFPQPEIAAEVRAELRRVISPSDVVDRLLPTDPILQTCEDVGVKFDSLDFAEFMAVLDSRFGVLLKVSFGATVAEVVEQCAEAAEEA